MAVLNISLPDKMKDYVEERLTEGSYSSTSEFFRDLIREDQKRRAQQHLEALLLQGLESGTPIEVTDEYIQQKRAALVARIEKEGKRGG